MRRGMGKAGRYYHGVEVAGLTSRMVSEGFS